MSHGAAGERLSESACIGPFGDRESRPLIRASWIVGHLGGYMTDFLTPEGRSERMSRIRSVDTRPELSVRRYLHAAGLRYRLHDRRLPGRPDIVLPKYGAVVFVHGCFWHAHTCQKGRVPSSRSDFWEQKFRANTDRDRRNKRKLRAAGWRVFTVWECSLTGKERAARTLAGLVSRITACSGDSE